MNNVEYDRSNPRPTVLIVGEYLLNFHPGANRDIEAYLERNGFEIIEARMTDVIRKTYFYQDAQSREFHVTRPAANVAFNRVANALFEHAHDVCDRIGKAHPLYEPPCRMGDLVQASDPIIHHTFDAGEGVLIAAEILHQAQHGCNSFVILQPFGCLPNHVVGRGIVKQLKERYPHANILPLDYDPDVSFAQYREQAANACDERPRRPGGAWRLLEGGMSWLGRKKTPSYARNGAFSMRFGTCSNLRRCIAFPFEPSLGRPK